MNTVREAAVRVMPPGTSSRNRLATPVTCRRCGMTDDILKLAFHGDRSRSERADSGGAWSAGTGVYTQVHEDTEHHATSMPARAVGLYCHV
jgi:hypothetical protein